jgi:hypothetical protein
VSYQQLSKAPLQALPPRYDFNLKANLLVFQIHEYLSTISQLFDLSCWFPS